MKKIVFCKHALEQRCGLAYFSAILASKIEGTLVHSFHGFSVCDEFYINMDIFELNETEISSIIKFVKSGKAKKTILLMHDYRFTYHEDELINSSNLIVNLSGEPKLNEIGGKKVIELFTPSSVDLPILKFKKVNNRPFSLTFGFFSPRKKSFKMYIDFYEFMLKKHPEWFHLIAASTHIGHDESDKNFLNRYFDSDSILVTDFLPNMLISELISSSDLGVFFYPTGIMQNNSSPMSFFSQGKTVITSYGNLTPPQFKNFTLNVKDIRKFNLSNQSKLNKIGKDAYNYYWKNLSWDIFVKKIYSSLNQAKID